VEATGVSVATYEAVCRLSCYKIPMHFENPSKFSTTVIKINVY
jgi:hypothetical protein